jgi:hypothetical protein
MSNIKELTSDQFAALKVASDKAQRRALMTEELEFFQNTATGHLGVLVRDRTDNDFGYAILAKTKDKYCLRYRRQPPFGWSHKVQDRV